MTATLTTEHAILAWLGPVADRLTPDEIDRLVAEAVEIDAYYADPDDQEEREAALTAACQYLLGELDLAQAGQQRRATLAAEIRARVIATQIAAMLVRDGAGKSGTARAAGIDRMTLLKRLSQR